MTLIRIQGNWGEAQIDNITALLGDVTAVLGNCFNRKLDVVTIVPGGGLPMAAFGSDNLIILSARDRRWAKYVYQYSHELCHLLTNHNRVQNVSPTKHYQVDEILCETASIFTLLILGEKWKMSPPYYNWREYAPALTTYANGVIAKYSERPHGSLYPDPMNVAVDRFKNGYIAVKLAPLFLRHPNFWMATESLPIPVTSVEEFMQQWREICPFKEAVKAITAVFDAEN